MIRHIDLQYAVQIIECTDFPPLLILHFTNFVLTISLFSLFNITYSFSSFLSFPLNLNLDDITMNLKWGRVTRKEATKDNLLFVLRKQLDTSYLVGIWIIIFCLVLDVCVHIFKGWGTQRDALTFQVASSYPTKWWFFFFKLWSSHLDPNLTILSYGFIWFI